MNLPRIDRKWSVGSVLAAAAAVTSMLVVIGGIWWMAAGISYATARIPSIEQQTQDNTRDIAVLKNAQQYNDARYGEILNQLRAISDKLDNKQDRRTQ